MKRSIKARNSRSCSTKSRAAAHVTEHSYEQITAHKAEFASFYEEADDNDVAEEEDDEAGHGLRQKPRKTCRMSSSKHGDNHHQQQQTPPPQQQKFVCSKCGKSFQSSKAMCGHMACHSEKDKASTNVAAKQKQLVMDSHSDTESGAKNLRRRSRRTMYKKHGPVADSKTKVDVHNNCSSGASGVEQEQEEVAICLMMLSRDSANWGGLNSIGDSSDNNSVVLEARSIITKFAKKDGLRNSGYDVEEITKKRGSKKIKTLGDSESGYVRNGAKSVETDMKIKTLKNNKLEEGSEAEPHLSLKKLKSVMDRESKYGLSRDLANQRKSAAANESCPHPGYNVANQYCGENLFETDGSPDMRKGKGIVEQNNSGNVGDDWKIGKHEYLGGHVRVRLGEGSMEMNKFDKVAAIFKRKRTQLHNFIDLNLPAPMEDEEASQKTMGSYGRFQGLQQAGHF